MIEDSCKTCHGQGVLFFGDKEEYDVQPCPDCQAD